MATLDTHLSESNFKTLKFELIILQIPSLAMSPGWTGTEAHVLTARSVQHCRRTEMHQEADRYANLNNDQGIV